MEDDIKFIIGGLIVITLIILGAVNVVEKSCLQGYSEYNPSWGFYEGCRVNWNGKLTPVDIIREIN